MLATIVCALLALSSAVAAPPGAYKVTIHPNGDCSKCLNARTTEYPYLFPLAVSPCNFDNPGTFWTMTNGATLFQTTLSGKALCIYGGDAPGGHTPNQPPWRTENGGTVKVDECANVPWPSSSTPAGGFNWKTQDGTIRLLNLDHEVCIDKIKMDESLVIDNNWPVQLWTCYPGNTNQKWTIARWS